MAGSQQPNHHGEEQKQDRPTTTATKKASNNTMTNSSSSLLSFSSHTPSLISSSLSSSDFGDASGITILLSNHEQFGFAERACYHFDLIETLTSVPINSSNVNDNFKRDGSKNEDNLNQKNEERGYSPAGVLVVTGGVTKKERGGEKDKFNSKIDNKTRSPSTYSFSSSSTCCNSGCCCCGVVSLLECVPVWAKKERKQRKLLKKIREFNSKALLFRQQSSNHTYSSSGDSLPPNDSTINPITIQEEEELLLQEVQNNCDIGSNHNNNSNKHHQKSQNAKQATKRMWCYQPKTLPLHPTFGTRVAFAYQLTRMVLCIDASPTLTSTFEYHNLGFNSNGSRNTGIGGDVDDDDDVICPMDRLGRMVGIYLDALVKDIPTGPISVPSYRDDAGKIANNSNHISINGAASSDGSVSRSTSPGSTTSKIKNVTGTKHWWRPEIAVTVIAVYPSNSGFSSNISSNQHDDNDSMSMLVRDYRIHDAKSASLLSQKVDEWAMTEVEGIIASRINPNILHSTNDISSLPASSSLKHMVELSNKALNSTLPPEGRPCIVIATDCRSVRTDCVLDLVRDSAVADVPLHVLDLSSASDHFHWQRDGLNYDDQNHNYGNNNYNIAPHSSSIIKDYVSQPQSNYPAGDDDDDDNWYHNRYPYTNIATAPAFSLCISDDSEALHDACKATGGCFLDEALLRSASCIIAGQVPVPASTASTSTTNDPSSQFHNDWYFAFKRRTCRPNALQWYTLFSLSPLCRFDKKSWVGLIPSPEYIRLKRLALSRFGSKDGGGKVGNSSFGVGRVDGGLPSLKATSLSLLNTSQHGNSSPFLQHQSSSNNNMTMFATYSLSPVRVKGILLMRIMDGYRPKRYGHDSQDADKVSVHFTLPLEFGTTLHYEFSYVASPYHNAMVGSANVKMFLSGDLTFVHLVKNIYSLSKTFNHVFSPKSNARRNNKTTVAQQISRKICRFLDWVRKEDHLESWICPLEWGEKLSRGTVFLNRLGELTNYQRYRHFRSQVFEVITCGTNASVLPTYDEKSELYECISQWSTQIISEEKGIYIKRLTTAPEELTSYCVVEIIKTDIARIYSVKLDFFEQVDANIRLAVVESLKVSISLCENLTLAPLRFSQLILRDAVAFSHSNYVVDQHQHSVERRLRSPIETMYHHESWELLKDPDLLPLITQRRCQFGSFWLLEENRINGASHTIFAKFVVDKSDQSSASPYLVQYHIQILPKVVLVDIFMDCKRGEFSSTCNNSTTVELTNGRVSLFSKIYQKVKERDQKCGRALRSRRKLLQLFDYARKDDATIQQGLAKPFDDPTDDVQRLLAYCSKISMKLRFFRRGSGSANSILADLTSKSLLSNSFEGRVVQLELSDPMGSVGGMEPGTWFLIQNDHQTIIFVHFPLIEQGTETNEDESSYMYRELTFFHSSVSGLYYTKADVLADDDDSTEGNETDNEGISDISDKLANAHEYNYARAAYLALRNKASTPVEEFHSNDFQEVLKVCGDRKITHGIKVSAKCDSSDGIAYNAGYKLTGLISEMLSPIPGGGNYFYYHGDEGDKLINEILESNKAKSSIYHDNLTSVSDPVSDRESFHLANDSGSDFDEDSQFGSLEEDCLIREYISPPLFLSFTLDEKMVSLEDISSLEATATLNAHLSVFDGPKHLVNLRMQSIASDLPKVHAAVAIKLVSRLHSFESEQALEHLLSVGSSLLEIDTKTVKSCLEDAENVATTSIQVYFFAAATNTMLNASMPPGTEGIRQGFSLLSSRLEGQEDVKMKQMQGGDFFATDTERFGWCYVQVPRYFGMIRVHVYHPTGIEVAEGIVQKTQSVLLKQCHRVNQVLLLENLHKTRSASELLISGEGIVQNNEEPKFPPGHFQCPITFRKPYSLNHRCSKRQAILVLENSVLNKNNLFAISNRRGVFVCRDEDGNVFYMELKTGSNSIELVVFGEQEAGSSITDQLNRLLEKKLLSMSVEALSKVLEKNQHFKLLPADISFLQSFQENWMRLENEGDYSKASREEIYQFPLNAYDPVMVLLYFRQNISGSTFFHVLKESVSEGGENDDQSDFSGASSDQQDDDQSQSMGIRFKFNPREFSLYYNASPSQLDPNLQGVSTLTDAGKKYSREAGTGIALIEISLKQSDVGLVDNVFIGPASRFETKSVHLPMESLRFRRVSDETIFSKSSNESGPRFYLSVRIVNTTLNTDILHKWIELSLNQVLVGWFVERNLEMASHGVPSPQGTPNKNSSSIRNIDATSKVGEINRLCLGLPSLVSILQSSHNLPHPAVKKIEFNGPVRSTSLSKITLNLLERGLLSPLFNDKKIHRDIKGLSILRISGDEEVKLVSLSRDNLYETIEVCDIGTNDIISDGPTDCPEYICVFFFCPEVESARRPDADKKRKYQNVPSTSCFLFQKVSVDDHLNVIKDKSLSQALTILKMTNPVALSRRIAFVLSVSSLSQSVLFYNWNPTIFQSATRRLKEIHDDALLSERNLSISRDETCHQQFGTIGNLEVLPKQSEKPGPDKKAENSLKKSVKELSNDSSTQRPKERQQHESISKGTPIQSVAPSRKIRRPKNILKPTLVGKSIEGVDMQAVAKSRIRESTEKINSEKTNGTRAVTGNRIKVSSTPSAGGFGQKSQIHKIKDSPAIQRAKVSSLSRDRSTLSAESTEKKISSKGSKKSIVDRRRDFLWNKYSISGGPGQVIGNLKEVREMTRLSYTVSISSIDPRLEVFLKNKDDELKFDWNKAFSYMRQDLIFSRCSHYESQEDQLLIYLFYFENENIFLMFELDEMGLMNYGCVIERRDFKENQYESNAEKVVEVFTKWVLLWLWHSSHLFDAM